MDRLKGKRALITGGTSGIGLETAKEFLKEGARVAVTGMSPATLEAARKELGGNALVIASDASVAADQKRVVEGVKQAFGGLDVLFLNAGVADLRPVEAWDETGYDRTFAINVKGPFFLIQALLPLFANPALILGMVPVGRFGRPSEVASAVVFLVSDESAFMVGGEMLIDGGLSL